MKDKTCFPFFDRGSFCMASWFSVLRSKAENHKENIILILAALLAGCSGSGPRQIASYPLDALQYPPDPAPVVVYAARLELETGDVDWAAARAIEQAEALGGYQAGAQFWIEDGWEWARLELAVPAGRFDELRRGLYALGTLIDEQGSGSLAGHPDRWGSPPFSALTLVLCSQTLNGRLPAGSVGWDPLRTFQRAVSVMLVVFRFLADALIWVLVVTGPFVLLAWLVRALLRRLPGP
jgi:hypothetical protein